jgi:serine phosphatase RsbU (regulator of sigma subunit)/anti-sigma regulatory factor (Ser/Thr protein kinase)
MGGAIAAMHYTGMAAAQFAPDSICTVTPSTIDRTLLGGMIGFSTVVILMSTVAIAAYDARFADANAGMVTALQAANEELAGYYATMEEERRIAKHLIDRLNSASQAPAGRVAHRTLPARYFSGDLVAVARTPGDVLYVLLADSTGHGLSAALGVLPVVQPFYAMSAKGFGIGSIAREMNAKVGATLPTGRFVAAAIASIDPWMGVVSVWNGGIPACHVIDSAGQSARRFASRQPPLGILDDAQFDASLESFHFDHDCQLILASDGLLEAENADGQAFQEEQLLEVLGNALPSVRLRTLSAALHGHLGYDQPDDDISIVVAECRRTLSPAAALAWRGGVAGAPRLDGTRLQLCLSAAEIRRADVVPALCNVLGELGVGIGNTAKIFIVLSELYNNAVDHGLLELESSLKSGPDGFDSYDAVRRERLQRLEHGTIDIDVRCITREGRPFLKIRVRDSGPGFAYEPYLSIPLDNLEATQQHGRGIGLLRSCCSAVEYKDAGREAEVYLPLVAAQV